MAYSLAGVFLATALTFWMIEYGITRWKRAAQHAEDEKKHKAEMLLATNIEYCFAGRQRVITFY